MMKNFQIKSYINRFKASDRQGDWGGSVEGPLCSIEINQNPFRKNKLSLILYFFLCVPPSALFAAPKLILPPPSPGSTVSTGLVARSTQFIDSNGYLWGTDKDNGSEGRKIVKFSPNGNPVTVYESTYTELLKPKGSDVTLGPNSYSVVREIWPLPDGNFIFSTMNGNNQKGYLYKLRTNKDGIPVSIVGNNAPDFNNKQAIMNIGERSDYEQPDQIHVLHQSSLSVATINGATVLFFGEYNVNKNRTPGGANDWVALWKSTDLGDSWSKVIEWNTNGQHQTSHIHGVRYNPYNQWIYILFGDKDIESGIVAWDGVSPVPPDNTALSQMGNYPGWKSITGSQDVRAGDIVFTPTRCVWLPDVDAVPEGGLFGQRANHDLSEHEATGPVLVLNNIPPIMGYRDEVNGNIYWSSFRTQTSTTEQKMHLWTSNNDGVTWDLAAKIDNYRTITSMPHSLFIDSGSELVFSGILGTDFLNISQPKGSTAYFHVNTIPVATAVNVSGYTNTAIPLTLAGTDEDGTVSQITTGSLSLSQGMLTLADGTPVVADVPITAEQAASLVFVPATNFEGTVGIPFTVTDNVGDVSTQANAAISVLHVQFPPVANNDAATTIRGQAVTIKVLANDTDPESNIAPDSVSIVTQPTNATVSVNTDGSIIYTPLSGFAGINTFTYTVKDLSGLVSNPAVVTVAVIAAVNDNYVATANTSQTQTVSVSAASGVSINDLPSGVTGRTFAVVSNIRRTSGSGRATIALNFNTSNGSFSFTLTAPNNLTSSERRASKRGTYKFTYTMTLNGVATVPATVTINVI